MTSENTNPTKKGWKSTEFWGTLCATILVFLMGTDIIAETELDTKIVTILAIVLGSLGYTASRTSVKSKMIQANGATPEKK